MKRRIVQRVILSIAVFGAAMAGLSTVSHSYHELDSSIHTYNMELVGYLGDVMLKLAPGGSLTEVQKHGDYAYASYVYNWEHGHRKGGFFIIDVSDPTNPTEVAQYEHDESRTLDVKINDDATLAVLSGETLGRDHHDESFQGVAIIDISDKTAPVEIGRHKNIEPPHLHDGEEEPEASGVHNVFVHGDYVYYTSGLRGVVILDISTPNDPIEIAVLPNPELPEDAPENFGNFPHDMFVQTHPSGRVFVYIANWDSGLQIWDVTVPSFPLRVSGWAELGAPFQNTHYVRPTPSGNITVVGPEFGTGFSGFLSIVDTSDIQNPRLLSTWAAPGHRWQHGFFQWTQHNFDVTEDRIYLGNYAAGVWAIDISDPTNPRTLGSFGPESFMEPPNPSPELEEQIEAAHDDPLLPEYRWVGAWGVEEVDGLLYVGDMGTGFYILQLQNEPVIQIDGTKTTGESTHTHSETLFESHVDESEESTSEGGSEVMIFH